MDRRRFIPGSEHLERRALQTVVSGQNIFGYQLTSNLNIPITYQQKSLRIERLPFYLEQVRPHRYLPKPEMKQIQQGLRDLMDVIKRPPPQALDHYNYAIRQIVSKSSLTAAQIDTLNHAFTAVMNATQAPPAAVQELGSALYTLVSKVDTASPLPAFLGTNDYSLVLQTALGVGRPMPPPTLPRIARNQGIQADPRHSKTPLEHPSFVGTYHFHTTIQLISPSGVVYGQAKVNSNNNFEVKVEPALAVGTYKFQLRAIDTVGHVSRISYPFLVKVVPRKHHR